MADVAIALTSQRFEVLSMEEMVLTGCSHRLKVSYKDINNAAYTGQGDVGIITIGNTPTKFSIDRAFIDVKTAFATTGTLTVQAGTDGDPDNFIAATSCKTAGMIRTIDGAVATLSGSHGTSSDVLTISFTSQAATGALADITAGELYYYFNMIDVASLEH